MRLVHFSDVHVTGVPDDWESWVREFYHGDKEVSPEKVEEWLSYHRYHKPLGLWVSDEDDAGWRRWCLDNDFRLEKLKYAHKVELNPKANILHLTNRYAIDAFGRQYQRDLPELNGRGFIHQIDWPLVQKQYDGILITPYQYSLWDDLLSQHMWYYGWDCASGCIWKPEAIKSMRGIGYGRLPKVRQSEVEA